MLSTLSALYGHLAETGAVAANPAALHRGRLGLSSTARDASPTVRLTAAQLRALLLGAGALPHGRDPRLHRLYATRAVAFVALLTLGLRISELVGLDRGDLRRTGGEDVLRVLGKGGLHREVYVTDLVATALSAYLAERDRTTGAARPRPRGRTLAGGSPLIATRTGGRCSRVDLYTLLRRIAAHAGPELAGVADRVHPHALRHAYVTIALEQDARIHHVQADVGHASIATTQHYDRGLRTRSTTAADLVAAAIAAVPPPRALTGRAQRRQAGHTVQRVPGPAGVCPGAGRVPDAPGSARHSRSNTAAMPCPPPTHMVTSAKRPPVRCSSWIALTASTAPEAPIGWPSAIAPPFGLTFFMSSSSPRATAMACAAKASFDSMTSIESRPMPAFSIAIFVAGIGPSPMMWFGTPATA